jgi:hypothetical protein
MELGSVTLKINNQHTLELEHTHSGKQYLFMNSVVKKFEPGNLFFFQRSESMYLDLKFSTVTEKRLLNRNGPVLKSEFLPSLCASAPAPGTSRSVMEAEHISCHAPHAVRGHVAVRVRVDAGVERVRARQHAVHRGFERARQPGAGAPPSKPACSASAACCASAPSPAPLPPPRAPTAASPMAKRRLSAAC